MFDWQPLLLQVNYIYGVEDLFVGRFVNMGHPPNLY